MNFSDLTLFRPGYKPTATNLLEPKGRWHGVEPFQVDCDDPGNPATKVYGLHRDIPVRNYPFVLHVDILHVGCVGELHSAQSAYADVELTAQLQR
jgi:hypothetical protein